jgi:hypothetical protein
MFILAIICYSIGGASLLGAVVLKMLGAKKYEGAYGGYVSNWDYGLRLFFRYVYMALLPLGGLLHYFS